MEINAPLGLTPRKSPVQARATATIEAIFEGTVQVLLGDGLARLTTTKVARRAGVSVGTMYQYYPHKQALLYAVLNFHLTGIRNAIEMACHDNAGRTITEQSNAVVDAYLKAKTERHDVTLALYRVAAELGGTDLIKAIYAQIETATAGLFATATDARFADLPTVNATFLAALSGVVRSLFERDTQPTATCPFRDELKLLCSAYLEAAKSDNP